MTLTAQLIELIESKAIGKKDSEVASWFVLDAIANFVAGRNSEQGRILEGWYLDEPAETSRTAFWIGALMHIQEVDDLHRQSVVHPGCVVIPTVLALGMREEISGLQMLEAVVNDLKPAQGSVIQWVRRITRFGITPQLAVLSVLLMRREHFLDWRKNNFGMLLEMLEHSPPGSGNFQKMVQ